MKFYWYTLLVIVFINVMFAIFSVDKFIHSILQGIFDIYSLIFVASFIAVIAAAFMFMLKSIEKAY